MYIFVLSHFVLLLPC